MPAASHTTENSTEKSVLPRRYQEEVFAKAQTGNIVAALNTGSGKTLISLLLIRWTSSLETSKGKVIVFLVPKVTLVEQQGTVIAKNTPLRVLKLHGALDIDLADRARWTRRFADHDVFVMTAQIFLNILTHSVWSIDRVSLMIFDECHHARKNHPYNGIMREYFESPDTASRPRIFGMTASPIWNPKDPLGSLNELEANLDSKVVGVHANIEELHEHSPKPVEIIKEFAFPAAEYDEFPSPSLWNCLQIFHKCLWDELEIPWNGVEMRYHATLNNLGPYAASLFLYEELGQYITRTYESYMETLNAQEYAADMDLPSRVKVAQIPQDFWQIQQIHVEFEDFFTPAPLCNDIPIVVPLAWCTPKVQTLVELLVAYHTSEFQGIVFVEQRHIATCLATILPMVSELKGLIRCGPLMGQGVNGDGIAKPKHAGHKHIVESFRRGEINLLIATSVAEEGLDFPACDLVVRFDPVAHMVGYVQSRGRARNKTSTFVIMVQKGNTVDLVRYEALKRIEPEVARVYQSRHNDASHVAEEDGTYEDYVSPDDLAERERYVVASSGAVLTYDNAIQLLHQLCSLIPRDAFTPAHNPKFSGVFEATLKLPSSLPLSPSNLTYHGPTRRSKKEAKRAVAFMAVKRLYELDVYDQYLLPVARSKGFVTEDVDGRPFTNVAQVPCTMEVFVKDPWKTGPRLWIHCICIDNHCVAGLVTGTSLPPVSVPCGVTSVRMEHGRPLIFKDDEDEWHKRKLMLEFTKYAIWYRITARPLTLPPSLFLIPIIPDTNQPDFIAMDRLVSAPYGSSDWSSVTQDDCGDLLIMNMNQFGRPLLLRNIRNDLTPMSVPLPGSRESAFPTFVDYFVWKWTRKKWEPRVPTDGPLVEAEILPRSSDGGYALHSDLLSSADVVYTVPNGLVAPRGSCQWIALSSNVRKAFEVLPVLCRRVTDVYRVQSARFELGLPPIHDNLLVEALTLPSANVGFNNQRMETLGDAVLELCTTVNLFNRYPNRHEGQLSILRQGAISNRFLLSRAKDIRLETYLTSEGRSLHTWRYTETLQCSLDPLAKRHAFRRYPRRSLQDCMEAILGASFLTGGIPMALQAGAALGLSFGGTVPWSLRYSRIPDSRSVPSLFLGLEESLGYTFHRSELLVEAITHPSFSLTSDGPSYQRLEFLGDALLDLVVINYLYRKFPDATSHQLSLPKAKAVCAPALASLAVRRLGLHKIMLVNRLDLSEAIHVYVPLLQSTSGEEIVKRGWKYEPPKALSDVFESVMGAILVDSAYNYEKSAAIIEHVMDDILSALSPSTAWDPVTLLVQWLASAGCSGLTFEKRIRARDGIEGLAVLVHGVIIAGPVVTASKSVAKFVVSDRALVLLQAVDGEMSLPRLCKCRARGQVDEEADTVRPAKVASLDDLGFLDPEEKQEIRAVMGLQEEPPV